MMRVIGRVVRLAVACCLWWSVGVQAAAPGATELEMAIERNDVASLQRWLDEGLNPDVPVGSRGSGLAIAAWYGRIPVMELFIARGANPQRPNAYGEQPLQLAVWNGHAEAAQWLLDHGAAINREGQAWSALHYAVFNGHDNIARELITRGADVNGRAPNGSTPLMLAARENREQLARVLLAAGADPKARNDWGDTALTLAMRYDHLHVGQVIASAEEFAVAVKAPKEDFGEPARSAAAPSEIEQILQKIREAEADGRPVDDLQRQLMAAVNAFRRDAAARKMQNRQMPLPYQPKSLVITAKRGNPAAERAQVVTTAKAVAAPVAKGSSSKPATPAVPDNARVIQAQIADTMRLIRLAEAQGRPADDLRRRLAEQVDSLKQ